MIKIRSNPNNTKTKWNLFPTVNNLIIFKFKNDYKMQKNKNTCF